MGYDLTPLRGYPITLTMHNLGRTPLKIPSWEGRRRQPSGWVFRFTIHPCTPEGVKKFEPPSPALRAPSPPGGEGVESNVYFPLAPTGRGARGEGRVQSSRQLIFSHLPSGGGE